MPGDWSRDEVSLTVMDYLAMLRMELVGTSYSKTGHNRELQRLLNHRSKAAIEFKHANISAVLIELGFPYVDGYKPRRNYQDLLRHVVIETIAGNQALHTLARAAADSPVLEQAPNTTWDDVLVDPPTRDPDRRHVRERPVTAGGLTGIDYLEREARNASLGRAGEEFVVRLEQRRLWKLGERRLADRVEHVVTTRGDGLGYDVLSFDVGGRERLIEVKTTRYGSMTPFFATRNEVAVSEAMDEHYHLYRLFRFEKQPRLFVLPGSLRQSVVLDPELYRASIP